MLKLMDKKTFTILCSKICLSKPMRELVALLLLVFLLLCGCWSSVSLPQSAVGWSAMIVVFPGLTGLQ